jgi:hypothetical protein
MTNITCAAPAGVVLDWRHAEVGPPEPCVLGDGPAVCRSPVKGVPCHKRCAEAWIAAHATSPADLARLVRQHSWRAGGR